MNCPYCNHPLTGHAPFCPNCNALLPATVTHGLKETPAQQEIPEFQTLDSFQTQPPLKPLKPFNSILLFLLSICTLNIYGVFHTLKLLDCLPKRFPDQTRSKDWFAKMFIPLWDIYCFFKVLMELTDRIEAEYKERNVIKRFPKYLIIAAFAPVFIPYVCIVLIVTIPILLAAIQFFANRLAKLDNQQSA